MAYHNFFWHNYCSNEYEGSSNGALREYEKAIIPDCDFIITNPNGVSIHADR